MITLTQRPHRTRTREQGILDTLAATDRFRTFIAAVGAVRMTADLAQGGLTIFVPSDRAFEQLPAEQRVKLLEDPRRLRGLLLGHMVQGQYRERDLIPFTRLPNMAGSTLAISERDSDVLVNDVGIVTTDILSAGGVVHELDGVMLV